MPAKAFEFPPDFGGQVRLFPLSDLVLFPGNILPLHIFESRYQEMLEDALHGDQLIAMATLTPGFEHDYYSRPPIHPVVCIGRVAAHQRKTEGTYDLILAGLRRAHIEHEIEPVRSFRCAKVRLIAPPSAKADVAHGQQAEKLVSETVRILPSMRKFVAKLPASEIPLAALTDVVAFHLPLKTELKLQLLVEADPGVRAKLLLDHLSSAESRDGDRRRYPTDFSAN